MKCLLDTHTVLWFFGDVEKLSKVVLATILDPSNEKYVSVASAWELAIKVSLGKLSFEGGTAQFFETLAENGFCLLPVREEHIERVETLPFLHRDPFDRILVASAMTEEMCLITADTNIRLYDVASLW